MNKYENGKIYKIVGENDLWYIGSTIQTLNNRLAKHNYRPSCMSRYLINPQIELIEDYPCSNEMELRMREQHYLAKYRDKCINYQNAYTTEEEKKQKQEIYKQENRIHRLKKTKEYYEKNKEKLSVNAKQKVECECGSIVTKVCLARHKQSKKHLNYLQNKNES